MPDYSSQPVITGKAVCGKYVQCRLPDVSTCACTYTALEGSRGICLKNLTRSLTRGRSQSVQIPIPWSKSEQVAQEYEQYHMYTVRYSVSQLTNEISTKIGEEKEQITEETGALNLGRETQIRQEPKQIKADAEGLEEHWMQNPGQGLVVRYILELHCCSKGPWRKGETGGALGRDDDARNAKRVQEISNRARGQKRCSMGGKKSKKEKQRGQMEIGNGFFSGKKGALTQFEDRRVVAGATGAIGLLRFGRTFPYTPLPRLLFRTGKCHPEEQRWLGG